MLVEMNEIREELQIDPRMDLRIERKLKSVIGKFERLTNRVWQYTEGFVQVWQPDIKSPKLWTKLYPMTSLAVSQWASADGEAGAVDVDPAWYSVNMQTGEITLTTMDLTGSVAFTNWGLSGFVDGTLTNGRFGWAQNVKAVITGGYTSDTCPEEIKEAIITQLKYEINRNSVTKVDVKSLSQTRRATVFMDGDLHPEFQRIIRNTRLRTYGAT